MCQQQPPLPLSPIHHNHGPPNTPQASDALRQMLDPTSKPGATMRKSFPSARAPPFSDLFSIGQYVRCTVIGLGGGTDDDEAAGGRRGKVALSLRLKRLCEGMGGEALAVGRCVPAVVKSAEDHVYTLGFGIKVRGMSGGWLVGWCWIMSAVGGSCNVVRVDCT